MPKSATILPANHAHIRVIDKKGNLTTKQFPLIVQGTTHTQSQNPKAEYTYLTLTYNHDTALTPTNPAFDWSGWDGILYWEQTPDGKLGDKPWGAVPIESHIPYYDKWDYFFYLHAISEVVYDISRGNYEKFESKFFMPNPCGNGAAVEVTFLADGEKIYETGVLRGSNSQNITISFDIPRGSKELTIKVTDAGNGINCDHFIFADARLLHFSETISVESVSGTEIHTDVNKDGRVTLADLIIVASRYGEKVKSDIVPNPDINRDGIVDIQDITLITDEMPLNAPSINAARITYQPVETRLLPNYPNPFNPETWIPYQLATDSNVTITIYDTKGVFVRRLPIGFQSAGYYYTRRSRAAYWDGRNNVGEPVASGVYFYQLQTDSNIYVKKMLVLK